MTFRVVLVEPLYAGNVGAVARVSMNFWVDELALVGGPQINNEMTKYAMHARSLLQKAQHYQTLKDAVVDCTLAIGFSDVIPGRRSYIRRPILAPTELHEVMQNTSPEDTVALVFGREDKGLQKEELEMCDVVCTIPTSRESPSLNLSHSVAVILYELSNRAYGENRDKNGWKDNSVTPLHETLQERE